MFHLTAVSLKSDVVRKRKEGGRRGGEGGEAEGGVLERERERVEGKERGKEGEREREWTGEREERRVREKEREEGGGEGRWRRYRGWRERRKGKCSLSFIYVATVISAVNKIVQ